MNISQASAPLIAASTALVLLAGCAPGANTQSAKEEPSPATSASGKPAANPEFNQAQYDQEDKERTATFEGDPAQPWLQHLPGDMVKSGQYKLDRPAKVCFSNASLSNTWRQTGWITMNQQLKVLQGQGVIGQLETRNAQDSDDTQVSDIDYFISQKNCDGYIIAPSSPKATAAAVERACATGKPVIIFDRGAGTDCMTSFIHSVGGMAWGIDSAGFIAGKVKAGGRVVALRTAPGVDVFETRWAAAQHIFNDGGIRVTDYITGADPTKIKSTITNEIAKGKIDAVWVDLGDQAVPAIEAFEDAGVDTPIVTGEDNLAYLRAWKKTGLDGFASVYSAFQWRTALLGMAMLFQGKDIPKDWVLPQVPVTAANLDEVLATNEGMPDGQYAAFGGEDLPGFPKVWRDRVIPVSVGLDLALELEEHVVTSADRADLLAIARALYPHAGLPDDPYRRAVAALVERAEREPAALHAVLDGLLHLRSLGNPIQDRTEGELQAHLAAVERSAFFVLVRSSIAWDLYDDHEVWAYIGYPGASYDFGGYLERGFNDLSWLPEPRITESDRPMTEIGPLTRGADAT